MQFKFKVNRLTVTFVITAVVLSASVVFEWCGEVIVAAEAFVSDMKEINTKSQLFSPFPKQHFAGQLATLKDCFNITNDVVKHIFKKWENTFM